MQPTSPDSSSTSNYEAIKRFLHQEIGQKNLKVNKLEKLDSTVGALHKGFRANGWMIERRKDSISEKETKYLVSSDSQISLRMADAKIWRHPELTDQICKSKSMTKKFLGLNSVEFPSGAEFGLSQKDFAAAYVEKMGTDAVLKPAGSGGSRGVTVGVTPDNFEKAWAHAAHHVGADGQIIVEEFVKGIELRFLVIGGEVGGAVVRHQPFVIGDGAATIDELIAALLIEQSHNARSAKRKIVPEEDFLAKQGYSLGSVLGQGEVAILSPFTILARGGGTIDITDLVSSELAELAINAAASIPHLEVAGIDILTESLDDAGVAKVVEVNTAAALDLHRYPTYGIERDVVTKIVDYFCK
ncbi:hypothetical protein [Corynebacterium stationis]|uniref:hypothetical protein n=1 Tax=Corynebacterium stationis TaxID=1705 RepID=UPI003F4AB253